MTAVPGSDFAGPGLDDHGPDDLPTYEQLVHLHADAVRRLQREQRAHDRTRASLARCRTTLIRSSIGSAVALFLGAALLVAATLR